AVIAVGDGDGAEDGFHGGSLVDDRGSLATLQAVLGLNRATGKRALGGIRMVTHRQAAGLVKGSSEGRQRHSDVVHSASLRSDTYGVYSGKPFRNLHGPKLRHVVSDSRAMSHFVSRISGAGNMSVAPHTLEQKALSHVGIHFVS